MTATALDPEEDAVGLGLRQWVWVSRGRTPGARPGSQRNCFRLSPVVYAVDRPCRHRACRYRSCRCRRWRQGNDVEATAVAERSRFGFAAERWTSGRIHPLKLGRPWLGPVGTSSHCHPSTLRDVSRRGETRPLLRRRGSRTKPEAYGSGAGGTHGDGCTASRVRAGGGAR